MKITITILLGLSDWLNHIISSFVPHHYWLMLISDKWVDRRFYIISIHWWILEFLAYHHFFHQFWLKLASYLCNKGNQLRMSWTAIKCNCKTEETWKSQNYNYDILFQSKQQYVMYLQERTGCTSNRLIANYSASRQSFRIVMDTSFKCHPAWNMFEKLRIKNNCNNTCSQTVGQAKKKNKHEL